MDILYRLGRATAGDVMKALPGSPSSSTVRTQLRVLEEKGHVRHEEHGLRYVYVPEVPRHAARKSALRHLVNTFFDGSAEKVVAAVLGGEGARLSEEELDRIADLLAKARKDGQIMIKVSLLVLAGLAVGQAAAVAIGRVAALGAVGRDRVRRGRPGGRADRAGLERSAPRPFDHAASSAAAWPWSRPSRHVLEPAAPSRKLGRHRAPFASPRLTPPGRSGRSG